MTDDAPQAIEAIEATIDGVIKQYKDGSWAIRILIDPPNAKAYLESMREIGTRIAIAKLGKPETPPEPAERVTKDELERIAASGIRKATMNKIRGPFGLQAKALRLHMDWMGNPKVWAAFGSDAEYRDWIVTVGCIASQQMLAACSGDVVAAHVRRIANGAGVAIKPQFSCVPLCDYHHKVQHQNGESWFDAAHPDGGKAWFDKKRMDLVHAWLWESMRLQMGVSSMSECEPSDLFAFATVHDIAQYLPKEYL